MELVAAEGLLPKTRTLRTGETPRFWGPAWCLEHPLAPSLHPPSCHPSLRSGRPSPPPSLLSPPQDASPSPIAPPAPGWCRCGGHSLLRAARDGAALALKQPAATMGSVELQNLPAGPGRANLHRPGPSASCGWCVTITPPGCRGWWGFLHQFFPLHARCPATLLAPGPRMRTSRCPHVFLTAQDAARAGISNDPCFSQAV